MRGSKGVLGREVEVASESRRDSKSRREQRSGRFHYVKGRARKALKLGFKVE